MATSRKAHKGTIWRSPEQQKRYKYLKRLPKDDLLAMVLEYERVRLPALRRIYSLVLNLTCYRNYLMQHARELVEDKEAANANRHRIATLRMVIEYFEELFDEPLNKWKWKDGKLIVKNYERHVSMKSIRN